MPNNNEGYLHIDCDSLINGQFPVTSIIWPVHMPSFLDAAEAAIPNFSGLKYTSGDLEQGVACLRSPSPGKRRRCVMLGSDTILAAALAVGFDSACMTTLNMWPQLAVRIRNSLANKDGCRERDSDALRVAQGAQLELSQRVRTALSRSGDWVGDMKCAMVEELKRRDAGFCVGGRVRRPRMV